MQISQINSIADLINYFWELDGDHDGQVASSQPGILPDVDENNDSYISPWEIMKHVNSQNPNAVFNQTAINSLYETNQAGKCFNSLFIENDTQVQGKTFDGQTTVRFHDNGAVRHGYLAENSIINNVTFKAGYTIFHPNGYVNIGRLAADYNYECGIVDPITEIGDVATFKTGTDILFYQSGKVREGTLSDMTLIQGYRLFAGVRLTFYENGKLKSAHLRDNTLIGERYFMENTTVWFREDGSVSRGILLPGYNISYFDEEGNITSTSPIWNTPF